MAIDWQAAWRHGVDLADATVRRDRDLRPRDVIWALYVDACQVARQWEAPPRLGFPSRSAWPEAAPEVTWWSLMRAYLSGELEEMPADAPRPPRPSARDNSRAEAVLRLWHAHALAGEHARVMRLKALYDHALGMPMRRIERRWGIKPPTFHRIKRRACEDVLDVLRNGAL